MSIVVPVLFSAGTDLSSSYALVGLVTSFQIKLMGAANMNKLTVAILCLIAFCGTMTANAQVQSVDSVRTRVSQIPPEFSITNEEKKIIVARRGEGDALPVASTIRYVATVLNTNFVVPIIRFNQLNETGQNNQKGNVSFFNSIGAGLSINRGNLEVTTNEKGEIINKEMDNLIGAQIGVLFAANTGSQNNTNIFAPTFSISVLNIQLGIGYELGSLPASDSRTFYTLAYGIPLAKLLKGGFYVIDSKQKAEKAKTKGKGQQKQRVQGFI